VSNGRDLTGNVLLEAVSGPGKRPAIRSFAATLDLSFDRTRFTPDPLPGDITGAHVFDEKTREFNDGPLFTEVVLADEMNRASPLYYTVLTCSEHLEIRSRDWERLQRRRVRGASQR